MEKNKLKPLTAYSESHRKKAVAKFKIIEPYIKGNISIKDISKQENIPIRTLYRWKKAYDDDGLKGLIHKTRSDSGTTKISLKVKNLIEETVLKNKRISVATIHRKILNECKVNNLPQPSYHQVYRVVKNVPKDLITLSQEGNKSYKTKFDLIHLRESNHSNELWQADHTLLDIEVLDEKNQRTRPWLTIIMDDYSRAIAGYHLTFEAPSAINTALTLHQAIWKKENADWPICGIPEKFYTDHGSDFTSNHLEQIAIDLKINLIFSTIGFPRGRGKIERFFQTVNQMLLESLPGYTKNSKTEKLLTFQEFEEKLVYFILNEYNHRMQKNIKNSPINKWNELNFLPNMPESLEQLDLLLLQVAKTRKVHSDGIYFQGFRYTNPNLAAYVGETILIRYTPKDLAEIRIFFKDQFLCTAIAPELSSFTVDIKEIQLARNKRKSILKKKLSATSTIAETLISTKIKQKTNEGKKTKKSKLKRYFNN